MLSDLALALYETHKHCPIAPTLNDCTVLQRYFLLHMSVEDINYRNMLEYKLNGIAKGVGITFTDTSTTDRRSNASFRERMKERQRKMKEKEE